MTPSTTNTAALDKGPWHVGKDARDVFSADFTADVALRISGDFRDDEHKRQYAEWLVAALNAATLTQQQGGEQEARELLALECGFDPDSCGKFEGAVVSEAGALRAIAAAIRTKQPAASEGDGAKVAELKAALSRAVEIDKELHARLQAVQRDRDEKDVRHFNEMRELRRDRDNLRERLNIDTSKQAAGEAVDHATAMEGWEVAMCEISEIAGNSSDDRIIRRARRVQEWIEAHRPTPPRHPADEEAVCAEDLRWLDDIAADLKQAGGSTNNMRLIALNRAIAALQAGTPT